MSETNEQCLTEQAFAQLKRGILDGSYAPGSDMTELALAEQLGFGRMPVRNALKQLQHEGWVEAGFRCKTRVRRIQRTEVEDMYQIRLLLEPAGLEEIFKQGLTWEYSFKMEEKLLRMRAGSEDLFLIEQADAELHLALTEVFGNRRLDRFCRSLQEEMIFNAMNNVRIHDTLSQYIVKSVSDWQEFILAVREKRQDQAMAGLLDHLNGSRQRALSYYD